MQLSFRRPARRLGVGLEFQTFECPVCTNKLVITAQVETRRAS